MTPKTRALPVGLMLAATVVTGLALIPQAAADEDPSATSTCHFAKEAGATYGPTDPEYNTYLDDGCPRGQIDPGYVLAFHNNDAGSALPRWVSITRGNTAVYEACVNPAPPPGGTYFDTPAEGTTFPNMDFDGNDYRFTFSAIGVYVINWGAASAGCATGKMVPAKTTVVAIERTVVVDPQPICANNPRLNTWTITAISLLGDRTCVGEYPGRDCTGTWQEWDNAQRKVTKREYNVVCDGGSVCSGEEEYTYPPEARDPWGEPSRDMRGDYTEDCFSSNGCDHNEGTRYLDEENNYWYQYEAPRRSTCTLL